MSKRLRVGINGFGRIGRILFRKAFDDFEIVGLNNGNGSLQDQAHLLKYDSAHGPFGRQVSHDEEHLIVEGQKIPMTFQRDPREIPWEKWGADIVFECTGAFKNVEANSLHLKSGAKRVIVSAPAQVDATLVYGINHQDYDPQKHRIVSNASCTTNCLAPVAQVLNDKFGIDSALMTTVHSYTNDQRVLDSGHKDLRRARAAAVSMIPTSTGAAAAVGLVLPELKGKIHGMAVRVPTPNVSLVDLVANLNKDVTAEDVNKALQEAASGPLKGVLACTDEPLVSIDLNGRPESSIVDMETTSVINKRMVKVLSWYDNEVGFSCRMLDLAKHMAEQGL